MADATVQARLVIQLTFVSKLQSYRHVPNRGMENENIFPIQGDCVFIDKALRYRNDTFAYC